MHRYDEYFKRDKKLKNLRKKIDIAIGEAIMTLNRNHNADYAIKEVEKMVKEATDYWFRIE